MIIKFFIHPILVPDMNVAKVVLSKYVADMNVVLAKNTNRSLVFEPETGIILTTTKPQSDSAWPPLPTENFEIWVHIIPSLLQTSYGGYGGVDISGAGVLAGLKWLHIYDPGKLLPWQVSDYSTQLSILLHELAHVFYAGIGEYYSLTDIVEDSFWKNKQDWINDPLLHIVSASTRRKLLEKICFSKLTSSIISGKYRNGIPIQPRITILVRNKLFQKVANAVVKVYNIPCYSPKEETLLFEGKTDINGKVTIDNSLVRNSSKMLNFITVSKGTQKSSKYISIFDMDTEIIVNKKSLFITRIIL